MRIEKTFLLNEISAKVQDTTFLYLVDFSRVTVSEIAELRKSLSAEGAQFHVVQNTLIRKVAESLSWPSFTRTARPSRYWISSSPHTISALR